MTTAEEWRAANAARLMAEHEQDLAAAHAAFDRRELPMARHHDRIIAAGTPQPKQYNRTERLSRPEIENLIRATVLPGGHRISAAAVRRLTDAWTADADNAQLLGRGDASCPYTGADCYFGG